MSAGERASCDDSELQLEQSLASQIAANEVQFIPLILLSKWYDVKCWLNHSKPYASDGTIGRKREIPISKGKEKNKSGKGKVQENNDKVSDLAAFHEDGNEEYLTTNQGVRDNDDQNSLKAGERGATLLEDFILREKITHFGHERIPERVVHARGG